MTSTDLTSSTAPRVSVIIPVYKVEQYLENCVDSVLSQQYGNLEVILVDDGSPDGSPAICDSYAAADPRVKVVHKTNGGLGFARNSGMDVATGEYIMFLDSDDWMVADVIATLVGEALAADAQVVMFGHRRQQPNGTVRDIHTFPSRRLFDDAASRHALAASLIFPHPAIGSEQTTMSVWSAMFHRSVASHRFYSEREVASEDMHFKAKAIIGAGKVLYVPVVGVNYRYTPNSLSRSYTFDKFYRFRTLTGYLRELFAPTCEPHAGDYCMLYAMGCAFQGMYMSDTPLAKRKEYMRKMCADPVWGTLTIDTTRLPRKERLLHGLISKGRYHRVLWLSEAYYFLKRRSSNRHRLSQA